MSKKQLTGNVVSAKTPKTVVVQVESVKEHKKYKKIFKVHKKYKAHVEDGTYQPGDRVVIEETRPISKDKRWRVISKKD